jgi:Fe2+ or Zn2+ uptake regulation protein
VASAKIVGTFARLNVGTSGVHVACLRSGKVREFESRLYEQLKEQIARDFHMKVTVLRTEVGGYCAECLQAMKE